MQHDPHQPGNPLAQLEPFDDPEPGQTWFVSLAGTIILIALVVAIAALNFNTEHEESKVKLSDRGVDAVTMVPTAPIAAAAWREKESALAGMLARGEISRAAYSKTSQLLLLQTWMKYERLDTKDQKQSLLRIPVSEAMKIVGGEYAAKAPAKKVAQSEPAAVPAGREARRP